VIIREKAKQVLKHVRTIVRLTQWTDMGSLGVVASRRVNLDTANLAGVTVQELYALGEFAVAHYALHQRWQSRWHTTFLGNRSIPRGWALIEPD
jgi:hypothetical protein